MRGLLVPQDPVWAGGVHLFGQLDGGASRSSVNEMKNIEAFRSFGVRNENLASEAAIFLWLAHCFVGVRTPNHADRKLVSA